MPTFAKPAYVWSGTEWVPVGPQIGAIATRWIKTAVGGETTLSGLDDNGLTLSYTPTFEQVYLNGVLLIRSEDYIATTGTSITSLTALAVDDVIQIITLDVTSIDNTYTQTQVDSAIDNAIDNAVDNIINPFFLAGM
jgi:hypothetical protein